MSEQIRTSKNGQQYAKLWLDGTEMEVHYCRTCALRMYTPNKGFGYRCAPCHEKAEGWC
tara:strand:- start:332 stop:508 length:177 start_codon:yes stop_codon:yes gene_type:complete